MQNNSVNDISNTSAKLREMSEALDKDIANAAIACVQVEDGELMGQLVNSLSKDHEYVPCLKAMWMELTPRQQRNDACEEQRLMISDAVRDFTSANTEGLDAESDERLAFFEMALRYVPQSSLNELMGFILARLEKQEAQGVYTGIGMDVECLQSKLRAISEAKSS